MIMNVRSIALAPKRGKSVNHPISAALLCMAIASVGAARADQTSHESPPAEGAQADSSNVKALPGYRPWREGEVRDWRASNVIVESIGGWRAYAREAQGAEQGTAPHAHPAGAQGHADPMHEGHK